MESSNDLKWNGTTNGNVWMHRNLIKILKKTNIRVIYAFVAIFVIPGYIIFRHKSVITTYKYFRFRIGYSVIKSLINVWQNHYVFGKIIVDRFAAYGGKQFDVDIDGYEYYDNLSKKEDGFIQLSSHIGNYELAGYTLKAKDKAMNALVFFGEKESIMTNRQKLFVGNNITMIPIKKDMSHLFKIDSALNNGEILSIPADRIFGSQKYVERTFLGAKAKFPLGSFAIPAMRNLDVLFTTVMKVSANKYKIIIKPLAYKNIAGITTKKDKIEYLAQQYVNELEKVVKAYPTQWFNYFDFWEDN